MLKKLVTFISVGLALCGSATAGTTEPILMLDTGGHMAMIRSVAFTPDGKFLVSASDDKSVRVWNLVTGVTERVIRGEVGEGEAGKALALALSPDGTQLAVAGRLAGPNGGEGAIRLYDLETGTIRDVLDGHKDGVLSLSYSPDGKLLASGSIDDTAIVWSLASGKALLQVHGDSGDINAVRFSRSGKNLVTAGDDKTVRVWRLKDGRQIAKLVGHTDVVSGLAVPVTGGTAFSASIDHTLRAFDDETGKDLGGFVDVGSVVTALAVSPDGTRVVSGDGAQPYKAHFLDASTGDELVSYGRLDSVISAAAFNADGSLVALAGGVNNEIHVVKVATGERITKLGGIGQSVFSVGFGKDGHSIAWGFTEQSHEPNARGPLEFQMRLPNAGQPLADPRGIGPVQDFVGARAKLGKLHLERRAGGLFRYFALLDLIDGKKPVATIERTQDDGYAHDSFTFLGKADAILSGGGHGFLTAFGRDGTKLRDYVGHTSNVWSVVASPDGKLVLSGSDDQTVRLWNAKTAENIVSMFLGTGGEWVMWTPDGYYAASPEGDQHVGWQINAGFDRSARFISAAQLKRHFYQPDLVRDAIALGSAKAAIAKAHLPPFDLAELANRQPPEFHFLGLNDGDQAAASPLKIALEIDPATDPAETVTALVNGRQVVSDALDLVSGRQRHVLELPLGKGDNEIVVTVANAVGSTEHKTTVRYNGKGELDTRGTLYVIAIGVDEYTELHQNLEYAGADAEAFAKTVAAKAGPLHQRVESVVLSAHGDQKPTSVNLRKAFDMLKLAKANDTIVIFLAGHGVNDGTDYLFLPSDATLDDTVWRQETVIKWQTLQKLIETTKGRRIMLVDTCHAGNAYNARLVKDAADASIVVFTATDAETLALEKSDLGHGVFTYSLIEGLDGGADLAGDQTVRIRELSEFVSTEVKKLTAGKQAPVFYASQKNDFVLGRL